MAIPDSKEFAAYEKNKGEGAYNNSTDEFRWAIVTNAYASVDSNATSYNISDFTVVASSGNYAAGSTISNTTWTQSGDTCTLNGDSFSVAADPANPVTGRCIVIYNETSGGDAHKIIDITADGTTPANTVLGLTYTVNAAGISYVQVV